MPRGRILSVQSRPVGSRLSAAIGAAVTSLPVNSVADYDPSGGQVRITDPAGTPQETVAYTDVDYDAQTITLSVATANGYAEDSLVELMPASTQRRALVALDTDDAIDARVPYALQSILGVGVRDDVAYQAETVIVEHDGVDWYVLDVLYKDAVVEGTSIDFTGTTVPNSDGLAPSSSPNAPTVVGGIGFLAVTWTGITNNDPVTYEVHISQTSGFTPSGSTKYGEVAGTMIFIKRQADGTPLEYFQADGTTPRVYYVKIIAKDKDGSAAAGSQGSGSMTQITTPDIAVDTVTASQIYAASVSTQNLGAVGALINSITAGDPASQHVEITGDGLVVKDSAGNILVNLPTDPNKRPAFNGDLIAQNLEVVGATLLGATTIAKGTDVTLEQKIADPRTAPITQITYPSHSSYFQTSGVRDQQKWFALAYTATGGTTGTVPCFYVSRPGAAAVYWHYVDEYRASDGAYLRTLSLPRDTDDTWGLAAIGTDLYVLFKRWSTDPYTYFLNKFRLSDLVQTGSAALGARAGSAVVSTDKPGLGTDGTDLFVVCGSSQSAGCSLQVSRFNTSLVQQGSTVLQSAITFDCTEASNNRTNEWGGFIKVGTQWFLASYSYDNATITRRGVYVFSGDPTIANNLTRVTDDDFAGGLGQEADGLAYDGTTLWSILQDETGPYKHTGWTWTAASGDYVHAAYTYYDSNATGGTHETKRSPVAKTLMKANGAVVSWKRAALTISASASLPGTGGTDDPDKYRFYAKRNTGTTPATGGMDRIAEQTAQTFQNTTDPSSVNHDPSSNNFPGSTAARILSAAPDLTNVTGTPASFADWGKVPRAQAIQIEGDGRAHMPYLVPVGTIVAWVGDASPTGAPPAGWLFCGGATQLMSDYPDLALVCGRTFGTVPTATNLTAGTVTAGSPDTITVTGPSSNASYVVGDIMHIAGATPTAFNGFWVITAVTGTTVSGYRLTGSGSGTWTSGGNAIRQFNVPDLRQRYPRGHGPSSTLGADDGKTEANRTSAHTHNAGTLATGDHTLGTNTTTGGTANRATTVTHNITGSTGSGGGPAADFPNVVCSYIIKH